jgi:hypothetical protein
MTNKIENKRSESVSWIYYFIFFIVIFISDDTFNFGTNENVTYVILKYIVYFILTFYLLIDSRLKIVINLTKQSLFFYMLAFAILVSAAYNLDISGGYVYQIWLFLMGYLIVNYYSQHKFIEVYLKLIYILSIISLIVFVASTISLSFLDLFPVQYNSAGASMYNLWVCIVFADGNFLRNTSIFREPGVFMIYLNVAILFELFFNAKIDKRNLFVFILAIFTTLSTAAFLALAIIFLAYLFTKTNNITALRNKGLIIALILISLIVVGSSSELYNLVFDKLGKDNIGEGSSLARGVSIFANFNIFFDNFLFGVGIKNYPALFSQYTLNLVGIAMDVGNNTNTITTILAVYGLLFGSLFIYMLVSFAKKASNSIIVRAFIFLVLIMLYSNEDLRYSLMSSTLLMWGLIKKQTVKI